MFTEYLSKASHSAESSRFRGEPNKRHVCTVKMLVAQSCPTLCDPTDHSLPSSSAHGIHQTRILEWVVISFFGGLAESRIKPPSPAFQEPPQKPLLLIHNPIGEVDRKVIIIWCDNGYEGMPQEITENKQTNKQTNKNRLNLKRSEEASHKAMGSERKPSISQDRFAMLL